jgi:hypothetical protein
LAVCAAREDEGRALAGDPEILSTGSLYSDRQKVVVELRRSGIDGGQEDEGTPVKPDRDLTQIARQASLNGSLLFLRPRGNHVCHRELSQVTNGEGEVASLGTPEGAKLIVRRTVGSGVDRGAGRIGVEGKGLVDLDVDPRDLCPRIRQESLYPDLVESEGDGIEVEEVIGGLRGDGGIALGGDRCPKGSPDRRALPR